MVLYSILLPRRKPQFKTNTDFFSLWMTFVLQSCHLGKLLEIYSKMSPAQIFCKAHWKLTPELLSHHTKNEFCYFQSITKKGFSQFDHLGFFFFLSYLIWLQS